MPHPLIPGDKSLGDDLEMPKSVAVSAQVFDIDCLEPNAVFPGVRYLLENSSDRATVNRARQRPVIVTSWGGGGI
jgi:hypothetical protein